MLWHHPGPRRLGTSLDLTACPLANMPLGQHAQSSTLEPHPGRRTGTGPHANVLADVNDPHLLLAAAGVLVVAEDIDDDHPFVLGGVRIARAGMLVAPT